MSTVWLSGCVSLDLDSNLLRNKSKCYRKKKKVHQDFCTVSCSKPSTGVSCSPDWRSWDEVRPQAWGCLTSACRVFPPSLFTTCIFRQKKKKKMKDSFPSKFVSLGPDFYSWVRWQVSPLCAEELAAQLTTLASLSHVSWGQSISQAPYPCLQHSILRSPLLAMDHI